MDDLDKCHLQLSILSGDAYIRVCRCLRAPLFPWRRMQMRMDDLQDLEGRRQVSREEFRRLREQAAMSQTEVLWFDKQMQNLRRKRGGRDERFSNSRA